MTRSQESAVDKESLFHTDRRLYPFLAYQSEGKFTPVYCRLARRKRQMDAGTLTSRTTLGLFVQRRTECEVLCRNFAKSVMVAYDISEMCEGAGDGGGENEIVEGEQIRAYLNCVLGSGSCYLTKDCVDKSVAENHLSMSEVMWR